MNRHLLILLFIITTPLTVQAVQCPDPLEAMGEDAWRQAARIEWRSEGQNFEPAQTFHPRAEGLHVSDDELSGIWQPAASEGELMWRLRTHFPFPNVWNYREQLAQESLLDGVDGFRPSGEQMTAARRHARTIRLLQRFPALLLLEGEFDRGNNLCLVYVSHPTGNWTFWLNPVGLPKRIMLVENDPLHGEIENIMHYADWRKHGDVQQAWRLHQEVDTQLIRREKLQHFELVAAEQPATMNEQARARLGGADVPAWAKRRSHWILRRAAAGAPMDTDPAGEVEFLEITPNAYQVIGGSHHNLALITRSSIVMVGAPWGPRRSNAVIRAVQQRWPSKPISHLVLTHHHEDHSGGLMTYVDQGVTLVLSVPVRHYFATIFARSDRHTIPNKIVSDEYRLNVIGDLVELYTIPNSHAEGMLAVYLRKDKLLFVSDLYSPGRDAQHPLWARELLNAIEWRGLQVDKIVGSHGHGWSDVEALRQFVASTEPAQDNAAETDNDDDEASAGND
ncbi:MAG: MBL fold metallo-hydrolase [Wenzhouxiangellaceae bacterium]